MPTLTVTHSESIRLNKSQQGSTNTFTISDIDQVFKRIVTVPPTTDTTLLTFATATFTSAQALDKDHVKYIRITNLDPTNNIKLGIVGENNNYQVKVAPKESFVLGEAANSMDAEADTGPAFDSDFDDIVTIICDTSNNACQVELFVASID